MHKVLGVVAPMRYDYGPSPVAYPEKNFGGDNLEKFFFALVPPYVFFSKFFQNFGQKHKGGPRWFFSIFSKKFKNHLGLPLMFFRTDRCENFFIEKQFLRKKC